METATGTKGEMLASYTERLSAALRIDMPQTVLAKYLDNPLVQFARFAAPSFPRRMVLVPGGDAFVVSLSMMTSPPRKVIQHGRETVQSEATAGYFRVADLAVDTSILLETGFDNIQAYFSRRALNEIALEQGACPVGELSLDYTNSTDDVVIRSLLHSLAPALEHANAANQLFIDHVAVALLAHVAGKYGKVGAPGRARGGLAPSQLRRAKEMLMSRIDGQIKLEELARECGLSRSHFSRAFRRSTGKPPHRWLIEHRLTRAQDMLLNSRRPLSDVANACGFADQSHFTRSFSTAMGVVPSEWRRLRQG